jgi:3-oxoacyl-[acyl-carrier-protein] synthase-3
MADVESFVFHQANAFMLEALRKDMEIPAERFVIDMADVGNTVSSTIPIALARSVERGTIRPGAPCMLVGFGVGLSWAACMIRLPPPA